MAASWSGCPIELDFHYSTHHVALALTKPAVITAIDSHGGWIDGDRPAIGGGGRWLPLDDVPSINARGVIFGACSSATHDFWSDHVQRLLDGKGFLGGTGSVKADDTRVLVQHLLKLYEAPGEPRCAEHAQLLLDRTFDAAKLSHSRAWADRWGHRPR
ncbi:hypothetical protein [Nocardia nova]|nr:hypothetical protein [Nocardia nova]